MNKWFIRGDIHGNIVELKNFSENHPHDNLIVVGDVGLNYWGNRTDRKKKEQVSQLDMQLFCVRGNHEMRPEDVEDMDTIYCDKVEGYCYWEEKYPNIFYLMDGEVYTIEGKRCLIIGGAYSVDKWYRLAMHYEWFDNEQLSEDEMNEIMEKYKGRHFDCVLSHTCPFSWQPVDLFLKGLDQSTVDNSMEVWMEEFSNSITFDAWCWGHYHHDRDGFYSDILHKEDEAYEQYHAYHKTMLYQKTIPFESLFFNIKLFGEKGLYENG